jgi:hypothetical protein
MQNRLAKFLFVGAIWSCLALPSPAQSGPSIIGVEEDWELLLGEPDAVKAAPQILTWMSPTASLDDEHFGIDMNHVQRPDFTSGGFQTKALRGESLVENSFSENGQNLTHPGDTVRWTQRMFLSGNQLSFEVTNGSSHSWGTFGGPNTRVRFTASQALNLNGYNPNLSAEWSGVGYGSNRVEYLRLKTVRLFTDDGNSYSIPLNIDVD